MESTRRELAAGTSCQKQRRRPCRRNSLPSRRWKPRTPNSFPRPSFRPPLYLPRCFQAPLAQAPRQAQSRQPLARPEAASFLLYSSRPSAGEARLARTAHCRHHHLLRFPYLNPAQWNCWQQVLAPSTSSPLGFAIAEKTTRSHPALLTPSFWRVSPHLFRLLPSRSSF